MCSLIMSIHCKRSFEISKKRVGCTRLCVSGAHSNNSTYTKIIHFTAIQFRFQTRGSLSSLCTKFTVSPSHGNLLLNIFVVELLLPSLGDQMRQQLQNLLLTNV